MNVVTGFLEHVGRLVHADVRDGEAARHRTFLATHLALFVALLAAVLLALALGHVPTGAEAAAGGWLITPLAAAAFVSRTGRLRVAEAGCLAAWAGFALTAGLCGDVSPGGAGLALLLLPLLALQRRDRALVRTAVVLVALGGAGLLAAAAAGLPTGARPLDLPLQAAALGYASLLSAMAAARGSESGRRHAAAEERSAVIAAATGDLVLQYDRTAGVVSASADAERLLGVPARALTGRGFFERVHVADRPAFLKAFSDAADADRTVTVRLRVRVGGEPADGRPHPPSFAWIELRARRLPTAVGMPATGNAGAVLALVRNISAAMEHELALEQAREEAERTSTWKDSFLANVSHELRTPLNAIIGFSEMLANPQFNPRDPARRQEYAGIILGSGHHLLSVVNSLLDMSKIEAGRFPLQPEPFALLPMVDDCCDMMSLKAEQAGIALERRLTPSATAFVGDQRACKQIVINLLSNALKFTPAGGQVTVTVHPQGNSTVIAVADTGVGIPPRDLGRLGDAFFQGQAGYDRAYEGTGLGLSVVRGLVGLHGGTIAVDSALGEGTRVVVRLPADCRTAPAAGASARIEVISRFSRPAAPPRAADLSEGEARCVTPPSAHPISMPSAPARPPGPATARAGRAPRSASCCPACGRGGR